MLVFVSLIFSLVSATGVSITEPVDGETYDGNWLPFRAIVENDNEIPDSVHYSLNGSSSVQIPRLNTDWYTYMANNLRTGYSEAPAPHDNTILWSAPITGFFHEFPTPVVYDGMVFYTSDSLGMALTDTLYALDSATGDVIWTYDTGYSDDAVIVVDGRLYTSADSIFCLDAYTGDRIWAFSDGAFFNSSGPPTIWQDQVLVCGIYVYSLDIETGELEWSTSYPYDTKSTMTAWNGMLFVPTFAAGDALYALDTDDGSIIWQNNDASGGYWDSSPTVVDGIIYINKCSESTLAIDATSGLTIWEQPTNGGTATIAYHDNRLYFATEEAPYFCLDATYGTTIWTSPYIQHGSSGVADGLVFFGESWGNSDSASVVALDCENGAEVWSYKTSSCSMGFQGSPSITDGVMYYACTDGYLYAFGTGLKYTYKEEYFYADVGSNELIVTSFDNGAAVAADTISFTVTQTGISLEPSRLLSLSANPNPFRSSAAITFELNEPGAVSLQVFDLTGRTITSLVDQEMAAGKHSIQWDGFSQNGEEVSAGLYLCRIESDGVVETTGLCLLR